MDPWQARQAQNRSGNVPRKASSKTNFLGGGSRPFPGPKRKVAKELYINVDADFKEGEYKYHLVDADGEPGR